MAHVGFRVYRAQAEIQDEDEHGNLIRWDGSNDDHDEWIPIYSPRIQPHLSRKGEMMGVTQLGERLNSKVNLDELNIPNKVGQVK